MKKYRSPLIVGLFLSGMLASQAADSQEPVAKQNEPDVTVSVQLDPSLEKDGVISVKYTIKNTSKVKVAIVAKAELNGPITIYSVDKFGTKTQVYPKVIQLLATWEIELRPGESYADVKRMPVKQLTGKGALVAKVIEIRRGDTGYICAAFSEPFKFTPSK